MAAGRLTRGLGLLGLLLAAPLLLYKVTEQIVAYRLGYGADSLDQPPPADALPTRARAPVPAPEASPAEPAPASRLRGVALVVRGYGPRGVDARAALDSEVPLTLAIEPFTPFALRISREAARKHKEVLVELPPPTLLPPADFARAARGALWWPAGVLTQRPFPDLPTDDLLQHGLFVVDSGAATGNFGELPKITADAHFADTTPDAALTRDPALVLVDYDDLPAALRWLSSSGARPLFASEVVQQHLGTKAAIPRPKTPG